MNKTNTTKGIKRIYTAIIGLGGGLITSFIYDGIKDLPISTTLGILMVNLGAAFKWVWYSVIDLLNYPLKVWVVAATLFTIYLLKLLFGRIKETKVPPKPDFANYTQQRFNNWIWRWEWIWMNKKKEWIPANFKSYCPNCDTELISTTGFMDSHYSAKCPRCGKTYSSWNHDYDYGAEVKAVVVDNIRKNSYPK